MTINANLFNLFRRRFPSDLTATLLEIPQGRSWSYVDLETETARLARFLTASGVQKGDRVVAYVDKSPAVLLLYLACLRGGYIYLPLNPSYTRRELAYFIADAEPRVIVCRPTAYEVLQDLCRDTDCHLYTLDHQGAGTLVDASRPYDPDFPVVDCQADDIAAILYTSGTTGRPKAR